MGDPNYWKDDYGSEWASHAKKVETLEAELKKRFPMLSLKFGLGAKSSEKIEIPPDKRDEADIFVWYKYQHICDIEVTGSDIGRVPPYDIWIRPGKYLRAKEEGIPTWFYLKYPKTKSIFVLETRDIAPYEKNVSGKYLTPTDRQKREEYIEIPCKVGRPESDIFDWIGKKIHDLTSI